MNSKNTKDASKTRILYIEDAVPLRKLFKVVVEQTGYHVDLAVCGSDGLDLHRIAPYDIVAIDYQLPDMNGLEVAREMLLQTPDLPIVFVTGNGSEVVAAEALALGVMHYVIKGNESVYTHLIPRVIDNLNQIRSARLERLAAAEALRESEARLRAIIDNVPILIYLRDKEGRYIVTNKKFDSAMGSNLAPVSARNPTTLFPRSWPTGIEPTIRKSLGAAP